jgi:hypothetical protein
MGIFIRAEPNRSNDHYLLATAVLTSCTGQDMRAGPQRTVPVKEGEGLGGARQSYSIRDPILRFETETRFI